MISEFDSDIIIVQQMTMLSNRIMVISEGTLLEMDSPDALLGRTDSAFAQMWAKAERKERE